MKPRKNTLYKFNPVGMDLWDKRPHHPAPGTIVMLTQPPGCPGNGTMGHCYIEDAYTGEFYGLCLENSLAEVDNLAEV